MKTMKIYEPAMCCPTGLCGVSVDPELLRISTVLNTLKENGIEVARYNLTSAPMEFVNNKSVAEFLKKFGPDKLPVIEVDDFIVITGRYPSNEEFTSWLELSPELLGVSSCCEDSPCCCGDESSTEDSCCTDSEKGCC
ncbi:MAG: arsenite efflux transporter metallochaperone ArsD [Lachnospiraceae bacterium]|nr:arsenite efflux transporter metallochaperone ArsD [Lachnospiraceae bacterium]